jgi:hypothetical protein
VKLAALPFVLAWLAADPGSSEPRALPWLHSFAPAAETAEPVPQVVAQMATWREPDPACAAWAYGGLSIQADVAAEPGAETVLVSFTQGVLVLDARGQLIASAMPTPCEGSADEVVALAAGNAHLDRPVIALAVTTGGHNTSTTWLTLFRVSDGQAAPIFTGAVEDHVGDRTRVGDVTLLPGALLYLAPSGVRGLWIYDAERQRYVEQVVVEQVVVEPGA